MIMGVILDNGTPVIELKVRGAREESTIAEFSIPALKYPSSSSGRCQPRGPVPKAYPGAYVCIY